MVNIDEVVKDDLTKVSEMDSFKIMDLLDLDGEDSAEAVQNACKAFVRSDLGKKRESNRSEFGGLGRRSARTTVRGGRQWG